MNYEKRITLFCFFLLLLAIRLSALEVHSIDELEQAVKDGKTDLKLAVDFPSPLTTEMYILLDSDLY